VGRTAAPILRAITVIARFSAMLLFVWPWHGINGPPLFLLSVSASLHSHCSPQIDIGAQAEFWNSSRPTKNCSYCRKKSNPRAPGTKSARRAKARGGSKLAGGVAHDFNNLLTIINGYSHMMLDSLSQNDAFRSHIEEILKRNERRRSARSCAFSRRRTVAPQPMDLNHAITNLEKMLRE